MQIRLTAVMAFSRILGLKAEGINHSGEDGVYWYLRVRYRSVPPLPIEPEPVPLIAPGQLVQVGTLADDVTVLWGRKEWRILRHEGTIVVLTGITTRGIQRLGERSLVEVVPPWERKR